MRQLLDSLRRRIDALPRGDLFCLGLAITTVIVLIVIAGVIFSPNGSTTLSPDRLQAPTFAHPMGTDKMGRDVFARVTYGTRITLLVALGTVAIGAGVGVLLGAICGYFGGTLDEVVMRVMDGLFAFPNVLLALVFVSLFGSGTFNVMWALGISFIPTFARTVRGEFIRCKHLDYVKSARLQGVGNFRVIFVHILPNISGVLLSNLLIGFNNAALSEAALSYLGIGSQPPLASLGQMISSSQEVLFVAPWTVLGPGLTVVAMVLGFSLMGEGLRGATEGLE